MASGSQGYTPELPVAPREKDDSNKKATGTGRVPQTVESVLTSAPAVQDVPETSASRSQPLTIQERVTVATGRINEEASRQEKMTSVGPFIPEKILEKYKHLSYIGTVKKQRDEWVGSYLTSKDYVATRRVNEEASRPKKMSSVGQMVSEEIQEIYKRLSYIGCVKKQRDGSYLATKDYVATRRINEKHRDEWLDSYLTSKDYVDVTAWFRYDSNGRKELLEIALSSLTKKVSAQSVGAILIGAWGLRSCEDKSKYVFEWNKPKMTNVGVPATKLEKKVSCEVDNGTEYRYIPPTDAETEPDYYELWERSATYICAALLRMVVKEESNMKNAWGYIKARYKGFYEEDILMNITPNLSCLTSIRQILQYRTVVKDTIGVFLLALNDLVGQDKRLCQMLYAQQMCYTGMHAYCLFLSCADKLGVPLSIFAALLQHPITGPALETIAMLLVTYEFPANLEATKKLEKGKTWKYARIFDQEAFSLIQTKNCVMLTSLLATITQKLGAEGAGDATKIRQIAGFVENQKDWLEGVAQKVINFCGDLTGDI